MRAMVYYLYSLLDDIDTLDDASKDNDASFRRKTRKIVSYRNDCISPSEVERLRQQLSDSAPEVAKVLDDHYCTPPFEELLPKK